MPSHANPGPRAVLALAAWLACGGCSPADRTSADSARPNHESNMTETHSHTNRLIHATSPYLLQHAHNPVDWYEWGPEAFEKARAEDKPVFLSIGYSACHWCHVMERESFENEDVAAIMNAHFVCIKVDREERPDLDDIYMTATQAMTGSGGWPMSVWLTPDQRPFYAGTYFPPDDHFGRPGFKRVLTFLADTWERNRDKVTQQAEQLTAAIQSHLSGERGDEIVPPSVVIESAQKIAGAFDHQRGGISGGGTNKFPPSMAMDVMLRAYHASRARGGSGPGEPSGPDAELLELVELTLDRMAQGGIYDQLGGGIARYSTDVDWLVPHFEKMLYDQALVSGIYLDAYRLTGKALYRRVAAEILDYVIDDLQSPEGGYYCTRDADSEGEEGRFYVWSKAEVEAALGEDAVVFCDYYDVTEDGNWEGHNILHVQRPAETVAKLHGFSVEALESHLKRGRETLLALREKRVKPHLDDKVIASWNGLMIASMARGYRILGDERYRESAVRAADFVLKEMSVNGQLNRTYRKGKTHTAGFLEDYAFMIEGLLNLYETTFELRWLDRAAALNQALIQHFRDDAAGGFFFTDDRAEKVLARAKDAGDSAIPSGNSVQLMNLLRLSILLDRKDLGTEAERVLRAFGKGLRENPFRSERMLAAVDFHHRRPREIALVTHGMNDSRFRALLDAVWGTYVPNQVIAGVDEGSDEAGVVRTRVPLLDGKTLLGGSPAAYVCRDFACKAPTADPVALRQQIEN